MSLVGKLEELPLPDLLQIIASNGKSGRLNLTRHDALGILVFRHGQIIYAASTSARETLGHLLLSERLVSEEQLRAGLELQHSSAVEKRLGSILLEQGAVSAEDLTRVLHRQTGKVIADFLAWEGGFFKFDAMTLEDHGEIGVDVEDYRLDRGLAPDSVLIDFSQRLADETAAAAGPEARADGSLRSLREVMAEIRSPEFTGEFGSQILRYAETILPRAVLFFLRRGSFAGISPHQHLKIPVNAPSILAEAAGRKATHSGLLEPIEWNLYLMSQLGGEPPGEAVAIPLIVNHRVLLVLYGDDGGGDRPLPPLDELEVLMLQVGLAMEKRLLEKRVEQFERLRGATAES